MEKLFIKIPLLAHVFNSFISNLSKGLKSKKNLPKKKKQEKESNRRFEEETKKLKINILQYTGSEIIASYTTCVVDFSFYFLRAALGIEKSESVGGSKAWGSVLIEIVGTYTDAAQFCNREKQFFVVALDECTECTHIK